MEYNKRQTDIFNGLTENVQIPAGKEPAQNSIK